MTSRLTPEALSGHLPKILIEDEVAAAEARWKTRDLLLNRIDKKDDQEFELMTIPQTTEHRCGE